MSELVSRVQDGEIAVVCVNNPPVNALSPGVPQGIHEHIQAAQQDDSVQAIVLMGGGRTFIAGADIKEFGKMTSGQADRSVGLYPPLLAIEDGAKPVVCAIHGTAFGGGLEYAQACHYRVAVASAQLGQPEVKLGIIPGAAGTQRLPRLVGIPKALEMCVQGNPIDARAGLECGLIDEIIDGDLQEGAVAFARKLVADGKGPRKSREVKDRMGDPATHAMIFAAAREMAKQRARGMLAPFRAIDAVEAATQLPFEEGCKKEAEYFEECLFSPQSKALIHIFFGEREVAKVPGISKDTPKIAIAKAAVVGAGTMGGGIAMVYANAGIPVLLKEVEQELLDRGMETIRRNYESTLKKGRLTQEQVDERLARIEPTLSYDRFSEADIVVEAVFENLDLKKEVFAKLDEVTRPGAVLASNTSSLDIDEIAAGTSRPQQVIGHHFFSPANVMRLLEVVRGKETSDEVIATSMALAKKLRKVGVLVGNCRGFVGNRMVAPYAREAQFVVEEGALPQEVDEALYDFGMAMGPLAMSDLAGIDVGWKVQQEAKHLVPEGQRTPLVSNRLYELGRYGQKTGAGWYRYESGNRKPIPDPEVEAIIQEAVKEAGIERRSLTKDEIVERTIYGLINEGAKILEEGIALRPVDIDIIYVYGYGFPPHRGGPMCYADQVGLDKVYERICELEKIHGDLWRPAPLLQRLAEAGRSFADHARAGSAGA